MSRLSAILIITGLVLAISGCSMWSGTINKMLPAHNRPEKVSFVSDTISADGFTRIAEELLSSYDRKFPHVDRFREAGILSYQGPQTCLKCHDKISYTEIATGEEKSEDLMRNLTTSSHYRFYTTEHPNVYGFNGQLADNFRMGKINRPCPKPGSFAMTAWAAPVILENGDTLSEGCGQCHIGGQTTAPLGEMMPGYRTRQSEKDAIDCLICHSVGYDMNRKQIIQDKKGRWYWDQDRSIRAALSVTAPTSQTCLRCHQHNFGGDIYVDQADSSFFESMVNGGTTRPRIKHPGSKRGTPFSPTWDVHAAAGVDCIECHQTQGHYIAKGTHTTTMMANDLPHVEVACENCHGEAPHEENQELADAYNDHIDKIACQTCHIPSLQKDNATFRDFATPEFEEHPGIYVYTDIKKETEPGKGIIYAWWNGDGTFLGNPIGDNPNGKNLYSFYKPTNIWPEFADFDYSAWYEETMRPIAQNGRPSKIYPMKLFNGRQHIDLQNMGPFGGMYLPYNLPTYYNTGDPDLAASREMEHPMMKKMYGWMFDVYMMDKFMRFMDIDGWNRCAYDDASSNRQVEPRWIPQDALLEASHAIRRDGALTCNSCHSQNGVMDFKNLGYDDAEIESLEEPRN
ncbi:MAG: nitrite reductase [candidate division Zixibacteria bacterium]|nr:nitrite reductase [candidate division Zixibacteria bacterium]